MAPRGKKVEHHMHIDVGELREMILQKYGPALPENAVAYCDVYGAGVAVDWVTWENEEGDDNE